MFVEHLDKLILRIIFCGIFLLFFYLCRYAHQIFYWNLWGRIKEDNDFPMNPVKALCFHSRIVGLGIIFSTTVIDLDRGLLLAIFGLVIRLALCILIYFASLFVAENIVLCNFDPAREIVKNKNLSYGIIQFSHSIVVALVISRVFTVADDSIAHLALFWLYSMVALGFSMKLYSYYTKFSFNELLGKKKITLAISYSGYLGGCAFLVNSTLQEMSMEIINYAQLVILKLLLIALIFPLFIIGVKRVFFGAHNDPGHISDTGYGLDIGYGVYEGALFFTSSVMTVVIIDQVFFGVFYP